MQVYISLLSHILQHL